MVLKRIQLFSILNMYGNAYDFFFFNAENKFRVILFVHPPPTERDIFIFSKHLQQLRGKPEKPYPLCLLLINVKNIPVRPSTQCVWLYSTCTKKGENPPRLLNVGGYQRWIFSFFFFTYFLRQLWWVQAMLSQLIERKVVRRRWRSM